MIDYKGIWLPDGEKHLNGWMDVTGQTFEGKPAYQAHKYRAAVPYCVHRRRAVDVGANVGLWTRMMTRDFSTVDAFEPVPEYRECFLRNCGDHGHWTLHNYALGAAAGRVGMRCPDPSSHGDTFVAPAGQEANAAADVEMRTLDSFELKDVDLIKVDCEGYELHVLRGAEQTLLRCRPVVIVEQKPGKGKAHGLGDTDAVVFLQGLGAKLCREISGDYIMAW